MKVPVKWLSEFVDIDRPVPELAHLLTMAGLEVEGISEVGRVPSELVTARIVEMRPHPNADRLTLCKVETMPGAVRQVVCGARNMKTGDIVVLAQPGTSLPDGTRIERARLRGEESEGMLCSGREIGIGNDHEGILILEPETPVGVPFSSVHPQADTVLDISITPNRMDCLSVLGVARDVAALTGRRLRVPPSAVFVSAPAASGARLDVEAPALCPTYYGRVITGVTVGPSPDWLVARLEAAGLRSINNVVDATNYILLERGQPQHAFDLDTLAGKHILVRTARAGEKLVCLDGVERTLDERDLAICDERGVVAIAGVMGGAPTGVTGGTRNIFLEAAWFLPESVRATARRAGLHTDASHRFERGVDPEGTLVALDALTELVQKVAGGTVVETLTALASSRPRPSIELSPARVNDRLGLQLSAERMQRHLEALRMNVTPTEGGLLVEPPSWRLDIESEADLSEEIARVEGYDRVPASLPHADLRSPNPGGRRRMSREIVRFLASRGLDQVINYAFVSPQMIESMRFSEDDGRARPIRLMNPLSEEMSVLRTSLLPSLLKNAAYNERHEVPDVRIFEVSRIFLPVGGSMRPREESRLSALLMGAREPRSWTAQPGEVDLYDLKGLLDSLAVQFRFRGVELSGDCAEPYLAPGQGWTVRVGDRPVGVFGALHPEVGRTFGLERPVYVLEVAIDTLWETREVVPRFRPLPRFPAVERDLAVVVDTGVPAGQVTAIVREVGGGLLESVTVFDVYRGKNIPEGKKSLAFGLVYRSGERTLIESEVQALHEQVLAALEHRLGAQLRT